MMNRQRFSQLLPLLLLVACGGSADKSAEQTPAPALQKPEPKPEPAKVEALADPGAAGKDIKGATVTYRVGEFTMKGYLAFDAKQPGKRPGVLVVHEWWGQNEYARERARKLAELGYTALALDMYGEGKTAEHPKDAGKFSGEVKANMPEAAKRFDAARMVLQAHPTTDPEKTAAIGYCFGGGIVLEMARRGMDLDAFASFHGTLDSETKLEKGTVKGKVMVFHGGADPFVKPEVVKALKDDMGAAEVDFTFVEYPEAVHAFTNPAATENGKKFELPLAYDEKADADSWEQLEEGLAAAFAN